MKNFLSNVKLFWGIILKRWIICHYILQKNVFYKLWREKSLHPCYLHGVDFDGVGVETVVVDDDVVVAVDIVAGRSGVNSVEWVSNHF